MTLQHDPAREVRLEGPVDTPPAWGVEHGGEVPDPGPSNDIADPEPANAGWCRKTRGRRSRFSSVHSLGAL